MSAKLIIGPLVAGFSCWRSPLKLTTQACVNSYVGLFFALLILLLIVGGGALIWHLSATAEFARAPLEAKG